MTRFGWRYQLAVLLLSSIVSALILLAVDALFDGISISWSALPLAVAFLEIPPVLLLWTLRRLLARARQPGSGLLVKVTTGLILFAGPPLQVALVPTAALLTPGFDIDGFWLYVWTAAAIWAGGFVIDRLLNHLARTA